MTKMRAKGKELQLQALCAELERNLPQGKAEHLIAFAEHYYASVADADLQEWRAEDLYGSTLACWSFLQEYKGEGAKIRVFNPDHEEHGWQSTHTVIEVLERDIPFIVDSLRMELNRRNLTIYTIHNAVLTVKRDADGRLTDLLDKHSRARNARHESLVSIQINRHTDARQLKELESALHQVLNEVCLVVDDFEAMMAKTDALAKEFETLPAGHNADDIREVHDFISWLKQHFTFLGYDEFEFVTRNGQQSLEAVEGSQLGLLRQCDDNCRVELFRSRQHQAESFDLVPDVLTFSKSVVRSQVHRPAHPDYISVKRFNAEGEVIGEARFLGLYTSVVYVQSSRHIPVVRRKVDAVMERSQLVRNGHNWKELLQILETYPRDDLFQISVEELFRTAMGIQQIHERRQIRLFMRRDVYGQFFSCLVYVPRDIYSTEFRRKVEAILCRELCCDEAEFNTHFSESILARTQFILRASEGEVASEYDEDELEKLIRLAARSWEDDLHEALVETLGEEAGISAYNRYASGFSASYRADFNARTAVVDIEHMEALNGPESLEMSFYRALERDENELSFKLFNRGRPLPLSDVLPVLENLGLRVIDEHPYQVDMEEGTVWIHDFNLSFTGQDQISPHDMKAVFADAFLNIWAGRAANDDFNRLVLNGRMHWRDVTVLRALAAYLKQTNFAFGQEAISNALNQQVSLATDLLALFAARFDPQQANAADEKEIEKRINKKLEKVASLNEDRVIRAFLQLIKACVRTNFYQQDEGGALKAYTAFKLQPGLLADIPKPKPLYEIFVYSTRVEGVHLRGGRVARGGLRWSDRLEDYRTEVLGLVKAQQVKNAVIVPVGAKGGFVAKQLRPGMSREEWHNEGVACYRIFISALLDITDNLVQDQLVAPEQVVRHDDDDPYLVVAADKGTASFSDIANEIAHKYNFWLGDAFASGGSQGYDHKKMGITARGAWVSVERHFREMGINTAEDDFTVVGIGDMGGDVFGNGMLCSEHIRLVAAFNHMHIFIDPDPDAASSYAERKRLFEMPRSSWADYNMELISKGGGIYERSAKSIALTPEVKALTGLEAAAVTPSELISALLCAQVDLIWNGGIGTYIKAHDESHADVGDKANDALRVNGAQLRAKVVGEGGNLGVTQRGRIEFALNGGRINTDFIDNAGGVDCSDHEVNIKILLNTLVRQEDMTLKQRNQLLEKMTDDVASLVLSNNYRQVQVLSLEEARIMKSMPEYRRFINKLEARGRLDRQLEALPEDEALAERRNRGQGLTRPELSVLLSYCKSELKEHLIDSHLAEDPYLAGEMASAFPQRLNQKYSKAMQRHRLQGEIIATQVANHMTNMMGVTFVERLQASTGASYARIARAFVLTRDVFNMPAIWAEIEALDNQISSELQISMMLELQHLVRRSVRWFVRNRRAELNCHDELELFSRQISVLSEDLAGYLSGEPRERWQQMYDELVKGGVPEKLASYVAAARSLYLGLAITEVCHKTDLGVDVVTRSFFDLGEVLELHWFSGQLSTLDVDNHWQALARESFRDDLDWQHRALVSSMLHNLDKDAALDIHMEQWLTRNKALLSRWFEMLSELKSAEKYDYALYTVAVRELFDLARACTLTEH